MPQTLLEEQLANATTKKAKGVKPSKGAAITYNAELQRIVRMVKKDINTHIIPALVTASPNYTADGWVETLASVIDSVMYRWSSPVFDSLARELATKFVNVTDGIARKRFNDDMKRIGLDIYGDSPDLQDYIDSAIYNNTQLIKSIPQQYLTRVQTIVFTNTTSGLRPSAITKQIQQEFGVTERRAKFIATDQTLKLNGDITERRTRGAGFPYFQWIDSDDEKVRHRHDVIANKVTKYGKGIYSWDDLPLSDKGVPIKPGSDYHCRCIARPVSQDEVDANRKAGRVNMSVSK